MNVLIIHSDHEADGSKPHACGLSHFFHIFILKTTFGARGLTSVSLTPVYELSGHVIMLSGKVCTGNKKVEVVPYGERSDYVEVLKKYRKRKRQE